MVTRTRTRNVAGPLGSFQQVGVPNVFHERDDSPYRGTCIDVSPAQSDQAFSVNHYSVSGHRAQIKLYLNPEQTTWRECKNYPLSFFQNAPTSISHLPDVGEGSDPFYAVNLLAATNPSKPVIDLPVSFLELRELPTILKTIGDSLIKTYAKKNLNREFGLTPLMQDALNLMKFNKSVAERIELFKKLRDKPQLRKASLYKSSIVEHPNTTVITNSAPAQCNVQHTLVMKRTTRHYWGYIRWTATPDFNKSNLAYADPSLEYLARRAVLGTNIDIVTLWNAVPWTWLADWFGNIGNYLEGNRSLIPVTPSTPRLCKTTTTEELYVINTSTIGYTKGQMPVTRKRVTKVRTIASASLPSAHLPLLTGRQLGILASLAILRT